MNIERSTSNVEWSKMKKVACELKRNIAEAIAFSRLRSLPASGGA
jgi:hypothetical protein